MGARLCYARLLDGALADALHEVVEKEVVEDGDGDAGQQRPGHQFPPEVLIAADEIAGDAERDRLLDRRRDEGERVDELLHAEREGEDGDGEDARYGERQDDAEDRLEPVAAVDARRLL